MELTEKERARWEAFKKTYSRDKTKIERVKKIKDIYSEVEGSRGDLTEVRARGRRQGAF